MASISIAIICFAFVTFFSTTIDDLVVLITFQSLNWGENQKSYSDKIFDSFYISMGQF